MGLALRHSPLRPPNTGGDIYLGRKCGGGREFINKRIFNFKWFGEWHDPSLTSQSWRGGVSHRGGGGEALTHTFSMPEPSLPGPGQPRPFSREVLEEKSGIQHPSLPSLPSLPQSAWVPD